MKIHYDRTGAPRKELAIKISKLIGEQVKYLGMPSCAYQIGPFRLDKEGTLEFEDESNLTVIEKLKAVYGIEGIAEEGAEAPQEADSEEEIKMAIPYEGFDENSLQNLENLIKAKGSLIKKALGIEELPIKVEGNQIRFPWFQNPLEDREKIIYATFISKLAKMAKCQKRISAKEKEVTNEKYAFRCFLLRLGFIGNFYKPHRKLLLSKLEGSSAFKDGKTE